MTTVVRRVPRAARRRARWGIGLGLAVAALASLVGPAQAQANTPPTAFVASDWTRRDVPLLIRLAGRDSDGDALTFAIDTPPAHGSLSCSASTWSCTYTPHGGYLGADRFRWHVRDGAANSAIAPFDLMVYPNRAPVAVAGSTVVTPGSRAYVVLEAHDPDLDRLTFTVVDDVDAGSLECDSAYGECTYAPDPGFSGVDAFAWQASDGRATSSTVRFTLHVGVPANDPPVAADQSASTPPDTPLSVTLSALD